MKVIFLIYKNSMLILIRFCEFLLQESAILTFIDTIIITLTQLPINIKRLTDCSQCLL